MDERISGRTKLFGVMGKPIKHTGSPLMYNFCFNYYGLDAVYLAFECDEEEVSATLDAIRRLDIRGMNVTMPCKNAVFKEMDEVSPAAKYAEAVNTIINKDGKLIGHITDGMGVVIDLEVNGIDVEDKNIVLMGAGGAASAIMVQCVLEKVNRIDVFNRSQKGLDKMAEIIRVMKNDGHEANVELHLSEDTETLREKMDGADILINATSLGMAPDNIDKTPIEDVSMLRSDLVVYDVVYNPKVTRLMKDAVRAGSRKVYGGNGMLMWQGACSFKLYTGLDMPVSELQKYYEVVEERGIPELKEL